MKLKKITPNEFQISQWSGGKTTQIAIDPPEANYADRTFAFRISSASVELDESTFTSLPDYHRIITPIAGQLALYFKQNQQPVLLNEMEFCRFDGGWETRSTGRVTDFNLMTRKGVCVGDAYTITLTKDERPILPKQLALTQNRYVQLIWCVEGSVQIEAAGKTEHLAEHEALQLDYDRFQDSAEIHLRRTGNRPGKLILTTICFT